MGVHVKLSVSLLDGPCGGRTVTYGQPLPMTLVIADRTDGIRWHDYTQTVVSQRYRHSAQCKCHDVAVVKAVNLDIAR